ncbi:hypothetical protein ACCM60_18895 [Pseudomonas chlororaphis subsp. aureofaciens]|uniref:hypothetical protein n=1 Tax=Pseudomonas chlororaphis TaxID=587753 RepID=UPI003557854F
MKKIQKMAVAAFLISFSMAAMSQPPQATIEGKDLRPVSPDVREAVTKTSSFRPFSQLHCKLIGKKIPITRRESMHFLTTENACGWGAALGPIWLVRSTQRSRELILSSGGYSLRASPPYTNWMPEIEISGGTAGVPLKEILRYDGTLYRTIK